MESLKVYTLQIGAGVNNAIATLEHSETLGAADLIGAVIQAKEIINGKKWRADSNFVRLLKELSGESIVMWVRPMEAVMKV